MSKSMLPSSWHVPEVFRERLGTSVGRQRHMVSEGHLLLLLHQPPKADQNERVGRLFWRSPDGQWVSNELGSGLNALNSHLDQYQDVIQKFDKREQAATTADQYFAVLDGLAPVYRASRNLYQVLQDARKDCPDYRELINLRDRAYDIQRTAELLFQETKNSLDYLIAKRVEEQSEASHRMAISAHRLNLLAAFFFPLVTLSTIFGVNLRHGFEEVNPPIPFLIAMGCGLVLGLFLMLFVVLGQGSSKSRR